MSWQGFWRVSVLTVLLVALGLRACQTGLAEAAFHGDQICAATEGKGVASCKMAGPNLSAVPVDRSSIPGSLSPGRCPLPDLAWDLVAADLSADLSARAPPLL